MSARTTVQLQRSLPNEAQLHFDGIAPEVPTRAQLYAEVSTEAAAKILVAMSIVLAARDQEFETYDIALFTGASLHFVNDVTTGVVDDYSLDDIVDVARALGVCVNVTDRRQGTKQVRRP